MKITNTYSSFPDQVVPDEVKKSLDYGKQVGQAIEGDWFSGTDLGLKIDLIAITTTLECVDYTLEQNNLYKNTKMNMAINGDLSYLNLDWKPVPIIPKFVDIVVNGM